MSPSKFSPRYQKRGGEGWLSLLLPPPFNITITQFQISGGGWDRKHFILQLQHSQ